MPKTDLCCGDWLEAGVVYLFKCVKCVLKEACAERIRQICVSCRSRVGDGIVERGNLGEMKDFLPVPTEPFSTLWE